MSEHNKEERLRIRPVLLSGGSGTRLWPLSRDRLPKQFLPLIGTATLFEATLARVADREQFLAPVIICGDGHLGHVREGLARLGIEDATIIVEPTARNTAPALALAACSAGQAEYQLVLPCDHHIGNSRAFLDAVRQGLVGAAAGSLVTFGVEPEHPETGYGYIAAEEGDGPRSVRRFVEKPDLGGAQRMIAEGGHYWNAGIFLWRTDCFLAELSSFAPDIHAAAFASLAGTSSGARLVRATPAEFARSPSISIDYAVMEKTSRALVVPVSMGWSDVGNWASLHALGTNEQSANICDPQSTAIDCSGCYIRSTGPRVVAVGVQDLVVIITDDVALVVPRSESQRVKEAAAAFAEASLN
jgi:mannose-1-phosphate guanylyltransferase/mannose-6-phosphate isomerase